MNGTNMVNIFLQLHSLALFHNVICPKIAQQTTIHWMFFPGLTKTCFVFRYSQPECDWTYFTLQVMLVVGYVVAGKTKMNFVTAIMLNL